MNIRRINKVFCLSLVTMLIMVSFVSAETGKDKFNQEVEGANYYQCFHEHHKGQKCDIPSDVHEHVTRNIDIEDIGIRAIPCHRCDGYITQYQVGTGSWRHISSTKCNTHANCSIQEYERYRYYEEQCGGTCGYFRSFDVPEYDYRHTN